LQREYTWSFRTLEADTWRLYFPKIYRSH
jgi:hypothetical protein